MFHELTVDIQSGYKIVRYGRILAQPFSNSVFGYVNDAHFTQLFALNSFDGVIIDFYFSRKILYTAGYRLYQLPLPVTLNAANTDDFTLRNRKTDIVEQFFLQRIHI